MACFNYKVDPMRLPAFVEHQLLSALTASPGNSETKKPNKTLRRFHLVQPQVYFHRRQKAID
jgi:hypothetical protein